MKAKCPTDIFGSPLTSDNVTTYYKSIVKITHPDHYNGNRKLVYVAEEATKILNSYYKEAKDTIEGKTPPSNTSFKNVVYDTYFKTGDCEYWLSNKFIDDNFCRVYMGERKSPTGNEDICLKISKDPEDNYLLINESEILKKISHKSMPILVDTFVTNDGNEANVIRKVNESYDLIKIKEMYPDGVSQEHVVWMMDRLLSVMGYLHINNVIHGGIEPGNILITPYNHNATLIDYIFAIDEANKPGMKYSGVNEFSAPEISKGSKPHPATDMYSLGKVMEYIITDNNGEFKNDVDSRLKNFISGFTQKNPSERASDAWEYWYKLRSLREEIFGARNQFLPFNIKKI